MPSEILLLTGAREAPHLFEFLQRQNSLAALHYCGTLAQLEAAARPGALLIAFLTGIVVPEAVLQRLGRPAYNFHPGPPHCPGRYPESFAAYRGETRFGATAHVMTRRVDEGEIVGVEFVDAPAGAGQMQLAELGYAAAIRLFGRLAPRLATDDAPLPGIGLAWSGRKTTAAEYDALCEITPDIDAEEFARRLRGFGENPATPLHLTLHGRRFVMGG
ncbi:formyltransferase family protein [Arenibaculum pallidiluteum]|uniref:formyltransferase family protein n=1 Tax=Arenibaculum pallidiluteum TaxID=2812559 RepID=UPI001A974598|nr:formyltransferase family protein [Arenibaculum pallidiluteum]